MNFFIKIISSVYKYAITGLFCLITLWLFLLSVFSTSCMTYGGTEYTYYVGDKPYIHILIFLLLAIIILSVYRTGMSDVFLTKINNDKIFYKRIRNILLIVIGALGLLWVLFTQTKAGADQYFVMNAAYCLRHNDPTPFLKDGYIAKYTNQIGIVFIYYLLGFIVGDYNNIFFQLLNVLMVTFTFKWLTDILKIFKVKRIVRISFLLLSLLFYPWILYSTFVYGNVPGLFFSVGAFLNAYRFFNHGKYKYAILSSVMIMFGIMVKSNYLIFFIALVIYVLMASLTRKKKSGIVFLLIIIMGFMLQSTVPKYVVKKISGCELNAGASPYAWVAMGTKTITGDYYADGWYSPKIAALYEYNDYDTEAEKEAAIEIINENVSYFADNPGSFSEFLAKKTASQWNNPAFQSFWIVSVRNSSIIQPDWVKNAVSVTSNKYYFEFLNIIQTIILTGCMAFAFGLSGKNRYFELLLLPMTVIGGFIFHTFWEGKCQYTLPYFVLLLPLAAIGYFHLFGRLNRAVDWIKKLLQYSKEKNTPALKSYVRGSIKPIARICLVLIMALLILTLPVFKHWYVLDYDNERYNEYIENQIMISNTLSDK